MHDKILSGRAIASKLMVATAAKINNLKRKPHLVVVLVGNDTASQIYVRNKQLACAKVGIVSTIKHFAADITTHELINLVTDLNKDPTVDAILIQLPLPPQISPRSIIDIIDPHKDVDGFSRINAGSLAINSPLLHPCTPKGILYLLDHLKINYWGKHAVIVGMSNIVGRPTLLELINRGTTVTICNSKTRDLNKITTTADILIVAIGKPKFITAKHVKPGAIVIDVGINQRTDAKICGDVDLDDVISTVSAITPVPGGVGPMTIAMLLGNTVACYELNESKTSDDAKHLHL